MKRIRHWKRQVAQAVRPVALIGLSLFFDRRYLTGRHFDPGLSGFVWAVRAIWSKNFLRLGKPLPWPSALTCMVSNPANLDFHPDDLNNFQSPGTYFQNFAARIQIGRGTYIAPNVGLITANHSTGDLDVHEPGKDIVIGKSCWIGMNAVILPGVTLGDFTVVAAGAVVNTSFPDGYVVVGGVPARVLKEVAG